MEHMDSIDEGTLAKARPVRKLAVMPKQLWSEILPGLWQGGTADWDTCFEMKRTKNAFITDKDFDTVITTYAWANPCDWGVKEIRYGYYDSDMKDMDFESINHVVDIAYADWKQEKTVLIRCQAGLNRSGLVMALVLMKDGYTAKDAIALIREKRSEWALCNEMFEAWLLAKDPKTVIVEDNR